MDTQIGTRPQIGALEIHQAYILASLNWLQQTRSLEMNHVAIEKAKLLGFDHSSVITDAEKYMNNLETFKCYNFFSQNFPGCIILKEEDFINLNVKSMDWYPGHCRIIKVIYQRIIWMKSWLH